MRDRPFLGSRGSFWRATQEVAGLGGDAKHFKSVTETSFSRYLGSGHVSAPLVSFHPRKRYASG